MNDVKRLVTAPSPTPPTTSNVTPGTLVYAEKLSHSICMKTWGTGSNRFVSLHDGYAFGISGDYAVEVIPSANITSR